MHKHQNQKKKNENGAEHLKVVERWKNKNSCTDLESDVEEESIELSENDNINIIEKGDFVKQKSEGLQNKIEENKEFIIDDNSLIYHDLENKIEENEEFIIHDTFLIDHDYTFKENDVLNSTPKEPKKTEDILEKLEPAKERGYYVSADPEIILHLQKPDQKTKGKGILQNANKQKPRSINGRKITFINTCVFDTITELLSNGVCNFQNFKTFIEANIDHVKSARYEDFPHLIVKYGVSGVNNIVYTYRGHILFSVFPPKSDGNIDCGTNIGALFSILMAPFDCVNEVVDCCNCKFHEVLKKPSILLPDLKIVWHHKYKNLEQEMNEYFKDKVISCRKCQTQTTLKRSVDHTYGLTLMKPIGLQRMQQK